MEIQNKTTLAQFCNYQASQIALPSGKLVSLLNPTKDDIDLKDIALGLSRQYRFNGLTNKPWTVLQHSMFVASLCPANIRLEALLHDAAEAYLGDVVKPLKNLLGSVYLDIEHKWELAIAAKFGLKKENTMQVLSTADVWALKIEAQALYNLQNNAILTSCFLDGYDNSINEFKHKVINEIEVKDKIWQHLI